MTVDSYIRGEYREDGDRLFSEVYSDKARGNGHKLQHGRSQLGTRRKENSLSECSNTGTDFPDFAEPQSLGYSKLTGQGPQQPDPVGQALSRRP